MMAKITSGSEKAFNFINAALLVVLCAMMIYPILYVLGRSFMTDQFLAKYPLAIIPREFSLFGYQFIFNPQSYILNSYAITIARTLIGTLCNLFFTTIMAYVISKKYYPGRKVVTLLVVFTMWFGGGLIPFFLLIRSLGLVNKFSVYIVPGLINAWNLILLRNFFMSIPQEAEESAKMDGANDLTILFAIYIPLSTAALATISLFYAVDHWNAWFDSLMFVSNRKMWTLQVMLREVINTTNVNSLMDPTAVLTKIPAMEIVKNASIVVATIPIICIYPFLQKYFVKGVLVGSLKG
jgi:putative aldouronate transport system permease protein